MLVRCTETPAKITHSKCCTNRELVSLHDIHEERRQRDKDGRTRPNEREHDVVDTCYKRLLRIRITRTQSTLLTFNHPLHFNLASVEGTLDPAIFPCEELDEFYLHIRHKVLRAIESIRHALDKSLIDHEEGLTYRTYELIDHSHTFVPRVRHAFVYAYCALGDEVVEWPADDEDEEAGECGPAEQSMYKQV